MGWPKGRKRSLDNRVKTQLAMKGNTHARRSGWAPAGMSRHALFNVYYSMINRCQNPEAPKYADYGGRGITVCNRWLEKDGQGFLNFLADMGERPKGITKKGRLMSFTLERSNNNGNYEPGNTLWANYIDQNLNRRV